MAASSASADDAPMLTTGTLSAWAASRQLRQPVRIITRAPHTALAAIGNTPSAARPTMAIMMMNASGAR